MNNKDRDLFRLGHIQDCIFKISELVATCCTFENFDNKWVEQDAMIRNFEIIGEAANHISTETKENFNQVEWHKIRGMRNFMTHEYFGIRVQTIWDTAVDDIPKLKILIDNIVSELEK